MATRKNSNATKVATNPVILKQKKLEETRIILGVPNPKAYEDIYRVCKKVPLEVAFPEVNDGEKNFMIGNSNSSLERKHSDAGGLTSIGKDRSERNSMY